MIRRLLASLGWQQCYLCGRVGPRARIWHGACGYCWEQLDHWQHATGVYITVP